MFGALSFHRERMSAGVPVTREAVVTVCHGRHTWPDVYSKEVHIGDITGAIPRHQRLQAATQRYEV